MSDNKPTPGHNNPPVIIELSPELAAWATEWLTEIVGAHLQFLQVAHNRETAEKMVERLEKVKSLRNAVKKATDEQAK